MSTSEHAPAWQRRQAWLFVGGVLATITATALGVLILALTGTTWMAALPFILPYVFILWLLIDQWRFGKLRARTWSNIWGLIHGRALIEPVAIGPAAPTVVRSRSEAILFLFCRPAVLFLAIGVAFASVRFNDALPAGFIAGVVGVFILGAAILAYVISFLYFERRRAPGEDWTSVYERGRREARSLVRTRRRPA